MSPTHTTRRQHNPAVRALAIPFTGYSHPPIRSDRAAEVARWFDLPAAPQTTHFPLAPAERQRLTRALIPKTGEITLLTGASGAGKSSLLRWICASRRQAIDLSALPLPDAPLVDCFGDAPLRNVLLLLSRVGLSEAWTYLRTPSELSDGQRWRLRLALAMHQLNSAERKSKTPLLIADEFANPLDRITAAIVASALRRMIDHHRAAAIVATSHDDLIEALAPNRIARCDFGKLLIERRNRAHPRSSDP